MSRVRSTTVSSNSSHVRAVVARRATSCRKVSCSSWSAVAVWGGTGRPPEAGTRAGWDADRTLVIGITIQAYGKVAALKVAARWPLGRGTGPVRGARDGIEDATERLGRIGAIVEG